MTTINIDNVEYDFDKLSEETKAQLIQSTTSNMTSTNYLQKLKLN